MPDKDKKPDALEQLLVEKYGVAPTDAAAFAAQIIHAPGAAGSHGQYLREEALGNVASGQLQTMNTLGKFPQVVSATQGGDSTGLTPEEINAAIKMMEESKGNTWEAAARQGAAVRQGTANKIVNIANKTNEGISATLEGPGTVEVPVGGPKVTEIPVQNPYTVKLQRAIAMRKAALGF